MRARREWLRIRSSHARVLEGLAAAVAMAGPRPETRPPLPRRQPLPVTAVSPN